MVEKSSRGKTARYFHLAKDFSCTVLRAIIDHYNFLLIRCFADPLQNLLDCAFFVINRNDYGQLHRFSRCRPAVMRSAFSFCWTKELSGSMSAARSYAAIASVLWPEFSSDTPHMK